MIVRKQTADGIRFKVFNNSGGKRRYVGTYDSRKAAEIAEQDFAVTRRKIDRGELPEDVDTRRAFDDAADLWLGWLETKKSRSEDLYRKRLQLYVRPMLGQTRIADITKAKVIGLQERLSARGLSPSSVNGAITAVSSAFRYFIDREWLDRNPCHGVKPIEDPEGDYLWIHTKAEMTRLLTACPDDLREMVAVTLATGLRIDELTHLQWDDVDLDRRLLTIHRGRKGTVKSGKLRRVPILDSVLTMLKERALRRGKAVLVFPAPDGSVRVRHGLRGAFKRALARAGLDTALRWHDLRHTFASHWMMDGGDIFKLSRVLGHANVKITMRYAHLAPTAFEPDYGRLAFVVPSEKANVYQLERDGAGRIVGRAPVRAQAVSGP